MSDQQHSRRNSFYRFVTDTGWSFVSSFGLVAAGFLLNVILGNMLGEEGLGVYALAGAIYMFVTTLAMFGVPQSLNKHTAEFVDHADVTSQFYAAGLLIVSSTTITSSLLLCALRQPIAGLFKIPELADLLLILALGVPFYSLNKVAFARLNGLRSMRRLGMGEILRYLFLILLTVASISCLEGGLVAAIWALSLTEILLFPILAVFTGLHRNLSLVNLEQRCWTLGWFGGQLVLSRIIVELNMRLNTFLIGALLTTSEVGIFTLAVTLSGGLDIVPRALRRVAGPAMAELYAKKQTLSTERLINQTTRISAFLLTLMAILLVMFFSQIVETLYPNHPAFLEAETALFILLVGQVFRGIVVSVSPVFISVNRPDMHFKIAFVRLITNSVVVLLMIRTFGIVGAAFGESVAAFLDFALRILLMRSTASIQVDYKPLFLIPSLGAITVLLAHFVPEFVSPYIMQVLLWLVFTLVVTYMWGFHQSVVRILSLLTQSIGKKLDRC